MTIITIDYVNWKGERSIREIVPLRLYFGSNEWHKDPQWLMVALDIKRGQNRTFALKDILNPESFMIYVIGGTQHEHPEP